MISVYMIKNRLNRYPKLKNRIKKVIIATPWLRKVVSKQLGVLGEHHIVISTITEPLESRYEYLSTRGKEIAKRLGGDV